MTNIEINNIIDAGRFFTKHGREKRVEKLQNLAHIVNSQINAAQRALDISSSPRMGAEAQLGTTGIMEECRNQIATFLPSPEELDEFFPDPNDRILAGQAAEHFKKLQEQLAAALNSSLHEVPRHR